MAACFFNLLLCALLAGPLSPSAWAVARPENRVGGSPVFSSDFASQETAKPIVASGENPGCGYDFASGVHKYLYGADDPADNDDPLGLSGESPYTSFGRAVENVIRQDFWQQNRSYRGNIERSIGYLVNRPAVGTLDRYPDLYNRQSGANYIYEIKPITAIKLGYDTLGRYLAELHKYDNSWRAGTVFDYYYWDYKNGPIITSDISGQPLPGGQYALVFPPILGVITYLPIPSDFPKAFSDFIFADLLMASRSFAVEGETAAAITPEAMGIANLATETVQVGIETTEIAPLAIADVGTGTALADFDAIGGVP
jgi:hypothetical protein